MTTPLRDIVDRLFAAVEAKDMASVLALLADDAAFVDPHYPTPRMQGKPAIADGLRWVFGTMRTLRFHVEAYFEAEDGRRAAVEMAADHELKAGLPLRIPQVFVVETRDGLVTRLQAYPPYGPGGIGGVVLALTRLWRRLSRLGR